LAFFTADGLGGAFVRRGITCDKLIGIIAQVAETGNTDQGRLAAAKLLLERAEYALRLDRVLGTETTRTLEVTGTGDSLRGELTEVSQERLLETRHATEDILRRAVSGAPALLASRESPTVDAAYEDGSDDDRLDPDLDPDPSPNEENPE